MTIHHLALVRDNTIVNVAIGESDITEWLWLANVLEEHDDVVDLGPGADTTIGVGWQRADPTSPFTPPEPDPEPDAA